MFPTKLQAITMDRIRAYILILHISSAAIVISRTEARASIGAIAHHHPGEDQFVSTPQTLKLANGLKLIEVELLDSLPTSAKWDNEPTSPSDPYAQSPYFSATPTAPPQQFPPPPLLSNSPPITTEPPCHDMSPPIPNNPFPTTPSIPMLPSPLLPSPIIPSPYILNPPTTSPSIPTFPPPSITYPPPNIPSIQYPPPPFPSTPIPTTPMVPPPPLESYPPSPFPYISPPIPTTPMVPPPPLESYPPPQNLPPTTPNMPSPTIVYPPPATVMFPPPSPYASSTPPTSSCPSPPPPYTPTTPPGQGLWCVAKPTVPSSQIEQAMNFACGAGADCQAIQPNGACFNPDSVISHASYAFNSYWQMTKSSGGTCDFGGTAMVVTVDPSYEACHFIYNFD